MPSVAHRRHPDSQAAARGDRACDDRRRLLGHGGGLAGDHRLVHIGAALDDDAVGGDAAPGRTRTTSSERSREIGTLGTSVRHALGGIRQQVRERCERAACLGDRAHLEPVAEEHDRDQRRELPPHFDLEPTERRGPRRHEGHGDGQTDEQHHPGLAIGYSSRPPRRKTIPPYRKMIVPRIAGRYSEPGNVERCSRTTPGCRG